MTRISLLLVLPLLALAGCASSPAAQQVADGSKAQKDQCVREYKVGSNFPVINCASPKTEEERQREVDSFRNTTRVQSSKGGS